MSYGWKKWWNLLSNSTAVSRWRSAVNANLKVSNNINRPFYANFGHSQKGSQYCIKVHMVYRPKLKLDITEYRTS